MGEGKEMMGIGSIDPAISLVVTTILVLVIFILALIQYVRKRTTIGPITIILLVVGLLFMVFLTYRADEVESADWAQIILMIGLIMVTAVYASSAGRQAEASVKMAEEMKKQLLSEARPYLLIRLEKEVIDLHTKGSDGKHYDMPNEFKVTIRNVGKGPAINVIAAYWRSDDVFANQPKSYLAPQEEWQTTISTISVDIYNSIWLPKLKQMVKYDFPGTVAVEYKDIHRRTWVTYLCLEQFDEEAYMREGEQNIVEVT